MIGVEVTDRAALAARSPSDLAMYLRSRNWAIRAETESAIYWIKDVEGEQYEALQEASERQHAVAAALASVRAEGLEPGAEDLALFAEVAAGRLSTDELRERVLSRYRR